MRPKIGPLNTKVRIERKMSSTDSDYGTGSEQWIPLAETWVNKTDVMPSRDESISDKVIEVSSQRSRMRFRWRTDITGSDRIVVLRSPETIYQIIGGPAEIGERRQYMEIMCEAVTTDGS